MVIAVNTTFLLKNHQEGYGNFIYECLIRNANQNPEHTFIFIFNKPWNPSFIASSNIIPLIVNSEFKSLWQIKFWYNYKVPAALKKYKADLFITADICSLRTKVPQLLIINHPAYPNFFLLGSKKRLKFYKKGIFKFLKQAATVVTFTHSHKKDIVENYKSNPAKIEVIYNAVGEDYKPIDFDKREKIKAEYSDGHEYFLVYIDMYHEEFFLTLLKAFSFFKKWQKSNMNLLIVTSAAFKHDELKEQLRLFKYRHEVKVLQDVSYQIEQIAAGAYALLDFSFHESFGIHSIQAMKCNVPVITSNEATMTEICGDAAPFVDSANNKDVAEKMMTIYKDEKLRNELIKKGKEQFQKYDWHQSSELLWQTILKASH
jgi:glycosyltransferase involved in cell wall biosynthesis